MFEIIRGTTVNEIIVIKDDNTVYKLQNNEKLIFGIKKYYNDNQYAVFKTLTKENELDDGYLLKLIPEDTINLLPEQYYFDVGLQNTDTGEYQIIIPISICNIIPSVTQKE